MTISKQILQFLNEFWKETGTSPNKIYVSEDILSKWSHEVDEGLGILGSVEGGITRFCGVEIKADSHYTDVLIGNLRSGRKYKLLPSDFNQGCRHSFQKYTGFTEVYEFCTLCDEKRSIV